MADAFRLPLASKSSTDKTIAKRMLERSKITVNPLKERFIKETGRKVAVKMTIIDADNALLDFPRHSDEHLRTLTFGMYQLKQASSYSLEHIDKDGSYDIFVGQKYAQYYPSLNSVTPHVFKVILFMDLI